MFCVFEKLRLEKVAKLAEERFCHFESISDCRNNLPSIIIIFFKYLNVENSKIKNKKTEKYLKYFEVTRETLETGEF